MASRLVWNPFSYNASRANDTSRDIQIGSPSNVSTHQSTAAFPLYHFYVSYINPHYRLLETGSTQLIRNTAAQQLADVQKAHPEELFNLLTRVVPYLRHRTWDTRVAAAKALGGICDNAEKYDPNSEDGYTK